VPSTFFVFRDELVAANPALVRGFARALRAATAVLREDPAAWQVAAGADAENGAALRSKWLTRIKPEWQADMAQELQKLADVLGAMQPETKFDELPQGTLSVTLMSEA
jgi:ABC-type nitrate/sulfonate/bicarbonate transport system substrate-binding protein